MYSMSLMQSAKVSITKRNIDNIMTAIKKRIGMRMVLQNEINKLVGSLEGMYHPTSVNITIEQFSKQKVKKSIQDQEVSICFPLHTTPRWCDLRS